MADVIIIVLLVIAVGFALGSIRKNRKRGNSCAGCPHATSCTKRNRCQEDNTGKSK